MAQLRCGCAFHGARNSCIRRLRPERGLMPRPCPRTVELPLFKPDQPMIARPIAILTAIPEEIAAFGDHLVESGSETVAGIKFHHGMLDRHPVVLAESGI